VLIVLVVLRPWLDDMQGLLLAHYPPDLLVFCAGIACILGVPVLFFRRRASGIMWFAAMLALLFSALLRQGTPTQLHFESGGRPWFYAAVSLLAVAIFVRFIYLSGDEAKRLTNRRSQRAQIGISSTCLPQPPPVAYLRLVRRQRGNIL